MDDYTGDEHHPYNVSGYQAPWAVNPDVDTSINDIEGEPYEGNPEHPF